MNPEDDLLPGDAPATEVAEETATVSGPTAPETAPVEGD